MGRKGSMKVGDLVSAAASTLRSKGGKLLADAGQRVEGKLLRHAQLDGQNVPNQWVVSFVAAPGQEFTLPKQALRRGGLVAAATPVAAAQQEQNFLSFFSPSCDRAPDPRQLTHLAAPDIGSA
eukprot:COSAG01_NODE_42577_length_438_cov_2.070796_1_plen_122_part_01